MCGNEAKYLQECVDTNFVSTAGPFVPRFEKMVAQMAGAKIGVATSSGTTGLQLALLAVGVGRDDLVILSSWTFIASANAIAHCGAMPWLFDVAVDSWTLDADLLSSSLDAEAEKRDSGVFHKLTGRKISAIMPVYTLGLPAEMQRLVPIAHEWGLPVIADCAAALGATIEGKPIGQLGADLSVFSFNGNKTLTCGGGGAVIGDDEQLCFKVKHLSTTARVGSNYDHDVVGFNYRMTNVSAAIGCAQMENAEKLIEKKRQISARYNEEFKDLDAICLFPAPKWAESACWFSGIQVLLKNNSMLDLIKCLQGKGIGARSFWKPMHYQAPFKDVPTTSMETTESLWRTVLTLPCSTNLSEDEQSLVIATVKGCLLL
jgi:dTDP-4-amino-4,6-dideoxygalactose transaminase